MEYFHCPKTRLYFAYLLISLPSPSPADNQWSFYCLRGFSFPRISYSWNHKEPSQMSFFCLVICISVSSKSILITLTFYPVRSVQFSHSVVSDSLQPRESQHARPPCPSPTPGVYSKLMSIELVMASNHLILCHPLFLLPSIFPSIRVFSNESAVHIKWPKY